MVGVSEAPLRFAFGYAFFIIGGIWAIGNWVTSDWLRKQKGVLRTRAIQRSPGRHKAEKTKLLVVGYSVTLFLILVTTGFIAWTRATQLQVRAGALKKEREDVFDHMSVVPVDLPVAPNGEQQVLISITNNGHAQMDNHTVQCVVSSLLSMNNVRFDSGTNATTQEFAKGLLGSGRGETVSCSTLVAFAGHSLACVGLDVGVDFSVTDQPTEKMHKWFRYSYYYRRQTPWVQESFQDRNWKACAALPDVTESERNVPLYAVVNITPKLNNEALPEPLNEKRPLRLNFSYTNVGNERARNYRMFSHWWIVPGSPDLDSVQRKVWKDFSNWMRQTDKQHASGDELEFGPSYWSTSEDPKLLTPKQIASIKAGTSRVVLTVAIPFEDSRGFHTQESCMYIQPPADPQSPWHQCGAHNSEVENQDTTKRR